MALATSLPVLTQYVVDKLNAAKTSLGIQQVFYGDQRRLPATPVVCVEPGGKHRELNGVPRKTLVTFSIYITAYLSNIDSVQINLKKSDELVEAIESLLHADSNMNGQVIHCMVTDVESGAANKEGTLVRASRLTLTCTSQEVLPYP